MSCKRTHNAMSVDAIPCLDTFGAKVGSAGLLHSREEIAVNTLKRLWRKNLVMVFCDQTFSDLGLVRFSRQFGKCYSAPIGAAVLDGDIPPEKTIVFNAKGIANQSVPSALAS